MLQIPLAALPNQRLSARIDTVIYDFWIRAAGPLVIADVVRDGVTVVQGQRIVPGAPIVPYRYLQGESGNFYILTDGDAYPAWERFGLTDFLIYATDDDLSGT